MLLRSIALGAWFLLGPALAQTGSQTSSNSSLISLGLVDPSTCVAPDEYTSCIELAVTTEQQCMNATTNDAAKNGCGCGGFLEQMNCYAAACWNRVYGCEYQSLVASYAGLCQIRTLPVPFWPAPDNAPGSCSCNTGEVLEAILGSQTSELSCGKNAESLSLSEIPAMEKACACCGTSISISAMYDICPNTDPTLIGLNALLKAVAPYYPWSGCVDSLNQFNCVSDLHFEPPLSTGAVYNPTDLPASGTQTLSNIAGEVTSPASGPVFSYTAIGQTFTVTALSINAFEAATTSHNGAASTGGPGTAVRGTGATGTSAGSPATTAKSGAKKMTLGIPSLFAAIMLCGVMVFL